MSNRLFISRPRIPADMDVAAIRAKTRCGWHCYSQEQFARAIGVSVARCGTGSKVGVARAGRLECSLHSLIGFPQ